MLPGLINVFMCPVCIPQAMQNVVILQKLFLNTDYLYEKSALSVFLFEASILNSFVNGKE